MCFFLLISPLLFLFCLPLWPLWCPSWSILSRRCAAPAEAAFWPVSTPTTTRWGTTPCWGTAPALSGRRAPSSRLSPSSSTNWLIRRSLRGNTLTRFEPERSTAFIIAIRRNSSSHLSFHQYGTKETGDVKHVPPGWEQWHALVRLPTHTGSICMCCRGARCLLCGRRWGTRSTTTTRCRSTGKRRSTGTAMKPIISPISSWVENLSSCSAHNPRSFSRWKGIYVGELWSFIPLESAVCTETDVMSQFGGPDVNYQHLKAETSLSEKCAVASVWGFITVKANVLFLFKRGSVFSRGFFPHLSLASCDRRVCCFK